MSTKLGACYLRKAIEQGDMDLLKKVLSPFLMVEKAKDTKKKGDEKVEISLKDLHGMLLHPVPGELLFKTAKNNNPEMLNVLMSAINNTELSDEQKDNIYVYGIRAFENIGDAKTIARFCQNGYKPSAKDLDSVLFQSYQPEILQIYLDNGAVERSNLRDLACIWLAGSTRHQISADERGKILKDFISHGMDIKDERVLSYVLQPNMDWSKEPFNELIEAGAPIVTDRSSIDPLCNAFNLRYMDAVKTLIEKTPNDQLHHPDFYGETPLMKVASERYYDAIPLMDMLVQRGADVNATDKHGRNALMYVNDQKTAEALIKMGANVFHKDQEGKSVADVLESRAQHSRYRNTLLKVAQYIKECAKNNQPQGIKSLQKQSGR